MDLHRYHRRMVHHPVGVTWSFSSAAFRKSPEITTKRLPSTARQVSAHSSTSLCRCFHRDNILHRSDPFIGALTIFDLCSWSWTRRNVALPKSSVDRLPVLSEHAFTNGNKGYGATPLVMVLVIFIKIITYILQRAEKQTWSITHKERRTYLWKVTQLNRQEEQKLLCTSS